MKILKAEKGITGLETAIILIAFVIVASVLSYVVISAGLFSSQKAKSAVNSGLNQSGATMEVKSNITAELGLDKDGATVVTKIFFNVGIVPGGSQVDLNPNDPTNANAKPSLTISYTDAAQNVPCLYWVTAYINQNNGDDMLDPGEIAMITIYLDSSQTYYSDATDTIHYMPNAITPGTNLSLSLAPPDGSVLPIERLIPSGAKVPAAATIALINLY
jgi:archaeal flagellin FlaB